MAHKTLIDGTAYTVSGGRTLADGTSYNVKNGKVLVDGTAYDISFILPPAILNLWGGNVQESNNINCITYANGYWAVGGQYYDGTNYYARIAYSTSLNGTWSVNNLWGGNSISANTITCITFANGSWVVGGKYCGGSIYTARIGYTANPDGTWTVRDLWTGNDSNVGITDLGYANGYWVVLGGTYDKGSAVIIAYATTPDGEWTQKTLMDFSSGGAGRLGCLTYANGYWMAGGYFYSVRYRALIYYATDPSQSWSSAYITPNKNWQVEVQDIAYADGIYMAAGMNNQSFGRIWYSETLNGTWTEISLEWDIYQPYGRLSLTYANGLWVVSGADYNGGNRGARLVYTSNPSDTWNVQELWVGDTGNSKATRTVYADGYWVSVGSLVNSSGTYACLAYSQTIDGFNEI